MFPIILRAVRQVAVLLEQSLYFLLGQRARDEGHENMSSTQQKFMQSHVEDFLSDERMDTIPYTTMYSPKFQRMKIEKPAKAQYLNQGSKFRLTSRKVGYISIN